MGQQEYDNFKRLIKEWADSHPNEYANFVQEMNDKNFSGFFNVCKEVVRLVPQYRTAVDEQISDERNPDFEKLEDILLESNFAKEIVNEFHNPDKRSIIPAMLTWLYYGHSYECMVEQCEELIKRKDIPSMSKWSISYMVKFIIKKSISSGMRTAEDWQDFRKQQKAIKENNLFEWSIEGVQGVQGKEPKTVGRKADTRALSELLTENQDLLIKKIGTRLQTQSTDIDIARLHIALLECSFIHDCPMKTFRNALQNQFKGQKIVHERGIQKAYNNLNSTYGNSNKLMKDIGDDRLAIDELKVYLSD